MTEFAANDLVAHKTESTKPKVDKPNGALVYYVEDDQNIRDLTLYALKQAGFIGVGFPDAQSFFTACEEQSPQLILLDIMLPGIDGLEILAKVREDAHLQDIPVIMLTAKGTEFDTISGLDAGADDYLAKPFSMMELISRVNALLRRMHRTGNKAASTVLNVGDITMDIEAHNVAVNGVAIDCTVKEFDLLRTLMENPGRVLSRAQLFQSVWGSEFLGATRTVDVHMQTLRQKLEGAKIGASKQIETVRGVGYRLRA